jgi:hypothetical protein
MARRSRRVSNIAGSTISLAAAMLCVASAASAAQEPTSPVRRIVSGPLPTVREIPPGSGSHGYPYDAIPTKASFPGAPTINLAHFRYAEREFLMSGTTNIYRQSGLWSSNGVWNVSIAHSGVPYTTRLLVRYPTNPAKFTAAASDLAAGFLTRTTTGRRWLPHRRPQCPDTLARNRALIDASLFSIAPALFSIAPASIQSRASSQR